MAGVVHLVPVETSGNGSNSQSSSIAGEETQVDVADRATSDNGATVAPRTEPSESKFAPSGEPSDFRLSFVDGGGGETEWGVGGLATGESGMLARSTLFHELDDLLCFDHPRVRVECAGMIARIASQLGTADLERCMSVVLTNLVDNLGHGEEEVRRSVARSLVVYVRRADDPRAAVRGVLTCALFHSNSQLRAAIVQSLPLLYADDMTDGNWEHLFVCLVSFALEGGKEGAAVVALDALNDLRDFVGHERLTRFIRSQMNEEDQLQANGILGYGASPPASSSADSDDRTFAFVDSVVLGRLKNMDDWKGRIEGVEQLKAVVKSRQDLDVLLEGQMPRFLSFLEELLNDPNFKVTLLTLEVYGAMIERLKWGIKEHVTAIVNVLVRHLGENKIVVRAQTSKVLSALTHGCGPSPVVVALCENLTDPNRRQNPRTREEILNAIILALLTFPSYEFDLYSVCTAVAPSLLDSKRRVRHATLECLAVLAQAMGPSKLATMASAIDAASEPNRDTEDALAAVLARLARRQLPRVTVDGQVEYSLRVVNAGRSSGSRAGGRSGFSPPGGSSQGADVDWIMAGNGSVNCGSAGSQNIHEANRFGLREGNQPASFPCSPSAPRRIVSPGYSKNSLPWKESDASDQRAIIRAPFTTGVINELDLLSNSLPFPAPLHLNGSTNGLNHLAESSSTLSKSNELRRSDQSVFSDGNILMKSTMANHEKHFSNNLGSSFGAIDSGRNSHSTDKASSRPMDKVAAMIGHNLLPSKLYPISDSVSQGDSLGDYTSMTSTTVVPLPLKSLTGNLSNTWPGGPGTLPALTPRKSFLGPVADAPVHTRPTLVRSSSGGKRSKIVVSKSTSSVENCGRVPPSKVVSPKGSSSDRTRDHSAADDGRRTSRAHIKVQPISHLPIERSDGRLPKGFGFESFDDYARARASVDSGVGSLVRPISPSSHRPHSLDSRRSHSLPRDGGKVSPPPLLPHTDVGILDWDVGVLPKTLSSDSLIQPGVSLDNVSDRGGHLVVDGHSPAIESHDEPKSQPVDLNGPSGNDAGKEESFNVVGRGMLPRGATNGVCGVGSSSNNADGHRSNEHILPAVHGKGVAHGHHVATDDDDPHSMSLSRSTFNKMMHRKLEIVQEAERRKIGKQQRTSEQRSNRFENNNKGEENEAPVPERSTTTRRRPRYSKPSGQSRTIAEPGLNSSMKSVGSSQSRTSVEVDYNVSKNPEEALKLAFRKLENEDWHSKCEGIKIVGALAREQPNLISGDIHNVNLALIAEVKNLRSTVSRAAIQCFTELFASTKKSMENDLEMICKTLLHKSGESNVFIKEDVERALTQMVETVTPQKACLALVLGGATHRNAAVRKTTAQFLCSVCEKLGPSRILSGTKDVTDRILPTAASFVMDGSPLTRYYGRKMLFMLISNPEFDRILRQNVQANTLRNIQDILGGLRTKGLGSVPNESASSRHLKASSK